MFGGEDDPLSHHYSGPDFGFPHEDARVDFTDLYAFPKRGNNGKSISIMKRGSDIAFLPVERGEHDRHAEFNS